VTVVGVYKDFPVTTDYPFKLIASYPTLEGLNVYDNGMESWNYTSSSTNCLALLDKDANPMDLERQFPDFVDKYKGEDESRFESFKLQPFGDIHFNRQLYNYSERTINKEVLLALGVIGLILIITACINFINLATAQAIKRSKEIGIRKVLGGYRTQLVVQFLSETFIITFFALLVSLGVAELLLINLTEILSYRLYLDPFGDMLFLAFLFGITAFVGVLSGLYPSFLLARINAISALRAKLGSSSAGGFSLRRALVIFQFGISQLLIICTVIVNSQMDYFYSKGLGFETDGILLTYLPENDKNQLDRLEQELLSHPEIEKVSFNISAPTGENNFSANFSYTPLQMEEDPHANFKLIDEKYFDLFNLNLLAGRALNERDSNTVVVNRQIVKFMGLANPEEAIGEKLNGGGIRGSNQMTIVGVVDDYHTYSLHDKLEFVIMMYAPDLFFEAGIKYTNAGKENVLKIVEEEWSKVYPAYVFDYDFLDEQLVERYQDEQGMAKLLTIFSVIAIFIGCLGLYGLITFL
ncbi:MAG: FtsX-like permease family protein, partial [Bacteroidota bacterium]